MLNRIIQIARRELRLLWTDSRTRSVVFLAPFLYASLFCVVYVNHTLSDLPIAVVQHDDSAAARSLIRMMDASPKLRVAKIAFSPEELKDLIYDQSVDAAIVIPRDFTRRLKQGKDARIAAYVNAASMVAANTAAKAINEVVGTFSAGVEMRTLMKKGESLENAKAKWSPVKLELRTLFNPAFNYSNFMVPGLLIAILQQVILLGLALCWTGEKERGTLKEVLAISRSPVELFLGKALPYLVVNFIVAEFYLRVLFPLNDIPMEGSWLVAVPFTALFVFTIVTWGMWVGCLFKTRLFATQALMFVAMPSFVLSGFTWPMEAMPAVARFLAHLLPMTYFVTSFRSVYLGGAPLRFISQDALILAGFAAANTALAIYMIRRLVRAILPEQSTIVREPVAVTDTPLLPVPEPA